MFLGVASTWNERKGLNDFIELSKILDPDQYKIVLVGLNDSQIKELTANTNILALPRTSSAKELAQIYSAADVFVNPSYEETFGLTTAEAQACGIFSIVYKDTACEEIICQDNGIAIEPGTDNILDVLTGI